MKTIRKFFFPEYFIRFNNGKFFATGRYFLFWVIATIMAALRTAHEAKHAIEGLQFNDLVFLPLVLGVIYHFTKKYSGELSALEISDKHWRSKLAALWKLDKTTALTRAEQRELKSLEELWEVYYDQSYGSTKVVKSNKFIPWMWIGLVLLSVLPYLWS